MELFPDYFSSNTQDEKDVFYGNNLPQDILTNDITVEDQLVHTISQEEANHFDTKTESWKFNYRSICNYFSVMSILCYVDITHIKNDI